MTCTAQRQLLLETAENQNFGTESKWSFLCPCINGVWKVLMDFVTLNKQKSVINLPDKKSASPKGRQFFVMASLKFGKVGQNFVKAKHTGRTRLQHSLTIFFSR